MHSCHNNVQLDQLCSLNMRVQIPVFVDFPYYVGVCFLFRGYDLTVHVFTKRACDLNADL